MSAFTTVKISRGKARQVAVQKVMDASDEELARMLDDILEPSLYRVEIVDSQLENDDEVLR